MKSHRRKILAALAATLLLLAGLASYLVGGPDSVGRAASQEQDPPWRYRIVDDPNNPAAKSAGKPPAASSDASKGAPTATPSPPDIPDFVKVEAPEYESWHGSTCTPPRPGSLCRVLFRGGVHSAQEGRTIHILIFENGRPNPAAERILPAEKGLTRIDHWVEWAISSDAEWTEFRTELRDASGKVLAKSFAQRYPIIQN